MFFQKVKYRLLLWSLNLLFGLGFQKLLLRFKTGSRILIFHGIDLEGNTTYNSRFVSVRFFDELLHLLSKHCVFIPLEDLYQKKTLPGKFYIAITFDDGLKNNFDLAIPILKKYQAPATFLVCPSENPDQVLWPDFLDLVTTVSKQKEVWFEGIRYTKEKEFHANGKTLKSRCKEVDGKTLENLFPLFATEWEEVKSRSLDLYWKLMNEEELKRIASDPLFTLGAHSLKHPNLTAISLEEAQYEMQESKRRLEIILGTSVNYFAFPFGSYTESLVRMGEEIGFNRILLVQKNKDVDMKHSCLERFVINPHISANAQLYFISKGKYV